MYLLSCHCTQLFLPNSDWPLPPPDASYGILCVHYLIHNYQSTHPHHGLIGSSPNFLWNSYWLPHFCTPTWTWVQVGLIFSWALLESKSNFSVYPHLRLFTLHLILIQPSATHGTSFWLPTLFAGSVNLFIFLSRGYYLSFTFIYLNWRFYHGGEPSSFRLIATATGWIFPGDSGMSCKYSSCFYWLWALLFAI